MEFNIKIPDYDEKRGFKFEWESDFDLEVNIVKDKVLIIANKDGLISLARHLINLSQDHYPAGYNFHLDAYNSLEDGSNELIIQKG